ncbi:MAG: glycosyltransferase family A protein [Planctomycetota bacterium]
MTESGPEAPRVSVIVPTYNRAAMVCDAIESVLAQTAETFEVLVIDDGSTDDTAARVEGRFGSDPRVRYVRKDNGGTATARQLGLELARGTYLALLDDDDRYLPRFFESQSAFLDEHDDVDLVFCDARLDAETRESIPSIFGLAGYQPPLSAETLAGRSWALPVMMMLRTGVARKIGFESDFPWNEDRDFLWRFYAAGGRAAKNPDNLSVYRWHEGDLGTPMKSRSGLEYLRGHLALAQRYAPMVKNPKHMLRRAHQNLALALIDEGLSREARPHLWQWWRRKPDSVRALRLLVRSLFAG